jgi:hypothetical protein
MTTNIFKNIITDVARHVSTIIIAAMCFFSSCSDYLDIVPDNVPQFEDLFVSRQQAYRALATCYAMLSANIDSRDNAETLLGDEFIASNPNFDSHRNWLKGISIMRGSQSANDPIMDYWTGNLYDSDASMYQRIRHCNLFIDNIDLVPDMTAEDKADWKGQVTFLKAYYMFKLVQQFGSIILTVDATPSSPEEDMFLARSKVDDCFASIVSLLDRAASLLKERAGTKEFGQIDKVIALTFKAQALLFRASPFYNGNSEYFSNFLDHDGKPFFPQVYDKEKWKDVIDAADVALAICQRNGVKLFHYTGQPYKFDTVDYRHNDDNLRKIYDLRFRIVDPAWNEEVIWGEIDNTSSNGQSSITDAVMMNCPRDYEGPSVSNQTFGWLAASLQSSLRYYTNHGLLLSEDKTVVEGDLYKIVTTPDETDDEYNAWRGILQPNFTTIQMYLNREPRFYNDLVISGGYFRGHMKRIPSGMYAGTNCGHVDLSDGHAENKSGIGVQKITHPESLDAKTNRLRRVLYPLPYLRYADLLLMKAEALNEYSGPSQEVYDLVDMVRLRAGIPTVEESYSNTEWVKNEALNAHKSQEGMREIIRNERNNEFAYEHAINFWDQIRWKTAVTRFSNPIWGWNYQGTSPISFFERTIIQGRKWSITDCLWPIKISEMEANANLIQNPGW